MALFDFNLDTSQMNPSYAGQPVPQQAYAPGSSVFDGMVGATNSVGNTSAGTYAPPVWNSWEGFMGTKETPGWGMAGLTAAQGINSFFGGRNMAKQADRSMKENKRQFQLNFDAQRNMTNSQMADRQNARLAANPNAFLATPEYMKQYGV